MSYNTKTYIADIRQIILSARNKAHTAVNSAMIEAYWLIGIMDFEFAAQCALNLVLSHYRLIMRLTDKNAMQYYLTEASENNWSVRTLDRNILIVIRILYRKGDTNAV